MIKIPTRYHVGGQEMKVRIVEKDEGRCGSSCVAAGYVNIANKVKGDLVQSESCKENTFLHELTHSILDTMGRDDLSEDEVFVSSFSGFLYEAMNSFDYGEEVSND